MNHRPGEWGHVWRYQEGRDRSDDSTREYDDAFIRQVDRRQTGVGFEIWQYDPNAESPEDPRDLIATIDGVSDSSWDGASLYLAGWVEGENGTFEDWGELWHRERWAWHPQKASADGNSTDSEKGTE